MDRREFLGTVLGALIAPTIAEKMKGLQGPVQAVAGEGLYAQLANSHTYVYRALTLKQLEEAIATVMSKKAAVDRELRVDFGSKALDEWRKHNLI